MSEYTGIDHVQLAMPPGAEDRARAFFVDALGFEEEPKPEPLRGRGGCWFRGGPVLLHVGVERDFAPQRKAHPAFLVGDIDGLARRLTDAGYRVTWDEALPGRRRFYTSDPFGNRIEMMADGDGFSQRPELTSR